MACGERPFRAMTSPDVSGAKMAQPSIDCHAHVYLRSMPASDTAWHLPPADASIEDYIAALDANGVRYAVLAAASIYGEYNDYSLEATRRFQRLRTTVIVSPTIDMDSLRRMKEAGVNGIRFQFRNVAAPPDLMSDEYQLLMRRAADLDWHIQLHDEGDRLPRFIEAIEMAGPRLVIDHFGRPDRRTGLDSPGFQAVLRAVERGRTWVKVSAAFRLEPPGSAQIYAAALLANAGAQRLLWGSDWPFAAFEDKVTYRQVLDEFAVNIPDPIIRREMDETALKLYFG